MKLTKKIERDWYIKDFIKDQFSVEYWDIVSIVSQDYPDSNTLKTKYLKKIKSLFELEKLIVANSKKKVVFVLLVNYKSFSIKIYRLLSRYNCTTVFFNWGAMPLQSNSIIKFALKYKHLKLNNLFRKLSEKFYEIAYLKLKLIKPYSISFNAGAKSSPNKIGAIKNVSINLCDYDQFLKIKSRRSRSSKKKYAVFLDINLAFQRDLDFLSLKKINPKAYFISLNNFFNHIEEKFNTNVVISLHPKSNYPKNTFLNRKVSQLNTAELVKDASFVISHYSTALSYAILFNKPLMFIYTQDMYKMYKHTIIEEIKFISNYFGLKAINIDNFTYPETNLKIIDKIKYSEYKYNFITSKLTEFIPNLKIIKNEFKKIKKHYKYYD